MKIDVYLHDPSDESAQLASIRSLLNGLLERVDAMSAELDALQASITALSAVVDNAVTKIGELAAGSVPAATLTAMKDALDIKAGQLQAAVVAAGGGGGGGGPA